MTKCMMIVQNKPERKSHPTNELSVSTGHRANLSLSHELRARPPHRRATVWVGRGNFNRRVMESWGWLSPGGRVLRGDQGLRSDRAERGECGEVKEIKVRRDHGEVDWVRQKEKRAST